MELSVDGVAEMARTLFHVHTHTQKHMHAKVCVFPLCDAEKSASNHWIFSTIPPGLPDKFGYEAFFFNAQNIHHSDPLT